MCCGVILILFGWFLRVPSLHMHLFSFGKPFLTCSCCFFYCVLEIVREKRGRQGEDAWSVKYETTELKLCCSQRTKNRSNASK